METVVAVAIGILAAIFLASLLAVVILCSHRYCNKNKEDHISQLHSDARPEQQLVDNMEHESGETMTTTASESLDEGGNAIVELDEVGLTNSLEQVLRDQAWISDATGLVPHCLDILKTCHTLTEKLVGMTMGNSRTLQAPEELTEIVAVARRISPRVDEVVQSMYPPLDPRLLEARCTALVLSVSHLVLVTKSACHMAGGLDWIDQALADVEDHLMILREASSAYECAFDNFARTVETPRHRSSPSTQMVTENGVTLAVNRESSQL